MAEPFEIAFCECCEPPAPPTPLGIYNRPALSELALRVGTFASFRQAMLEAIAREDALRGLTTRESTDYAVTILELWAAVADVLTFYQERIGNELYLRTARERDSVLRLARLIDYRLRPGLAATTRLAFTLDAGAKVRIPVGLKVMSVPGQDEKPQFFETVEAIAAEAALNEVPVFAPPVGRNPIGQGSDRGLLWTRPEPAGPGDKLLFLTAQGLEQKVIGGIVASAAGEELTWSPPVQASGWTAIGTRVVKELRRLRFLGHNAPDRFMHYDLVTPNLPPAKRWVSIAAGDPGYRMDFDASTITYPLDARYEDLKPGARLAVDTREVGPLRVRVVSVTSTEDRKVQLGQIEDNVTHVTVAQVIDGTPLVMTGVPGQVDVVAASATGAALEMQLNPAADGSVWDSLSGGILTSGIAGTSLSAGRIDVFARGLDRGLWHASRSGGAWSGWTGLGGAISSDASAVAHAPGAMRVFVRGIDFGLWYRDFAGAWGPWTGLGGFLMSAPAVVSPSAGRVDAFVRGADDALWYRSFTGGSWTPWRSLKGELADRPVAIARGPNRIDVLGRAKDGNLRHIRWNGTRWSDWASLDRNIRDVPAVCSWTAARLDVFVRGGDDHVYARTLTGDTWSGWADLGGAISAAPSVATAGPSVIHLVGRGADGTLVQRSLSAGGWGAWHRHGPGLGAIAERRQTRIFEIGTAAFGLREYVYPETIAGNRVVAAADRLGAIDKGRTVLLHDGGGAPQKVTVTGSAVFPDAGGDGRAHLIIDVTPAVAQPLAGRTTVLYGNVASATHGETQPDEPLGNGDTATPFQRFLIRKAPLTYVPSRKTPRGTAALSVHVNGERWTEVETLFGRRPDDRVYALRQQDTGETLVQFGDGIEGARLPTGQANVVARYRQGLGLGGRVAAGQLSVLLQRPVGLRAVSNPAAAEGGADPETLDQARDTAPTTVKTFGRIVSLQDFESLVTASGLVARAHATWVWRGLEKAVHMTVAAQEGAALSAEALGDLHAALDAARDVNHALLLANVTRVPIEVRAKLVTNPAFERDEVLTEARERLLGYFSFARMPFARPIHASDIHAVLHEARGVVAVDLDVFHVKGRADWTAAHFAARGATLAAVQPHIRLFSARPSTGSAAADPIAQNVFGATMPAVLPAEQAYVASAIEDVTLTPIDRLE